jgi:hypothetical protein
MDEFIKKSERRIQRFRTIVTSQNSYLFIRKNHFESLYKNNSYAMDLNNCIELYNIISKYNKNHKLLVINEYPTLDSNNNLKYSYDGLLPIVEIKYHGNITLINTRNIICGCDFNLGDVYWNEIFKYCNNCTF